MDSRPRSLPVLWTVLSLPLKGLLESSPPESVGHYHWPPTSSRRPIGPLRRKVYAYLSIVPFRSVLRQGGPKRHPVEHSQCAQREDRLGKGGLAVCFLQNVLYRRL